jgi:hypothetical protein
VSVARNGIARAFAVCGLLALAGPGCNSILGFKAGVLSDGGLGEPCNLICDCPNGTPAPPEGPCSGTLVCVDYVCRAPCGTSADCPSGETCITDDTQAPGSGKLGCVPGSGTGNGAIVDGGLASSQPVILASAQGAPSGIAVDPANVYWTNGRDGTVMECAIGGCNGHPTPLASNQNMPGAIVVDATNVYWTTNVGVVRCAIAGCNGSPTSLSSVSQGSIWAIASDGSNIYWTNEVGVFKCASSGCGTPINLAGFQPGPQSIAVDSTNVYWAAGGQIMSCPTAGCAGNATMLVSRSDTPISLASDGTSLYWIEVMTGGSVGVGGIVKCAISNCSSTITPLASDGWSGTIALDPTSVYWTSVRGSNSNSSATTVSQCAVDGCNQAPTTLETAQGVDSSGALAVDATSVYWTSGDSILKSPK